MADDNKSKLEIYSIGIVAANKPSNSNMIEVTPIEDFSMLSGQITDNVTSDTTGGTDSQGVPYQNKYTAGQSIKAKWMGVACANRVTSPDVRRGELVVIYKYANADADKGYFWVTMKQDINLRRLETVVYAWSGNPDDSFVFTEDNMADNMYYFEVSTHRGHIILHTSAANDEFTTYDLVVDTANGRVVLQDGIGNQFLFDSQNHRIYMLNVDSSSIDMDKENLTINIPETFQVTTKTFKVDCEKSELNATTNTINATTTHNGNLTENGAFQLNGDMKANAGTGGSGGTGSIVMSGDFRLLTGSITVEMGGVNAPLGTIHGARVTSDSGGI